MLLSANATMRRKDSFAARDRRLIEQAPLRRGERGLVVTVNTSPLFTFRLEGTAERARANVAALGQLFERFAALTLERGYGPFIDTNRPSQGTWTPQSWARTERFLTAGALNYVSVSVSPSGGGPELAEVACRGLRPRLMDPPTAETIVSLRSGPAMPLSEDEFVEFCLAAAEASALPQGGLSRGPQSGRQPGTTPEQLARERERELAFDVSGPLAFDRFIRGVSWALWLTARHIDALGGRARVLRQAPVERIVPRPSGLWLQLTQSPRDVPESALAELERFLAPVIPLPEEIYAADPPIVLDYFAEFKTVSTADRYLDYDGQPAPYRWLDRRWTGYVFNVYLAGTPSTAQAEALERAVRGWYLDGNAGLFTPSHHEENERVDDDPEAVFHSLGDLTWDRRSLHWYLEFDDVPFSPAVPELMRRLAGWSATWNLPIGEVTLGVEEP